MNIEEVPENIRKYIHIFGNHWLWIGAVRDESRENKQPVIRFADKLRLVNRVMLHLAENFDLESELQANHKIECNMSLCVNPEHLYAGTQADNVKDRDRSFNNRYNGRNLCKFDHLLSVSPTTGHKYCQTCKNIRRDEWRKNKKALPK